VLRRYFTNYGPATLQDFRCFCGYRMREVNELVRAHGGALKSATCGGTEYYYLGRLDLSGDIPQCLFLAGFDPMLSGYADRGRICDPKHRKDVLTNTGILFPSVAIDGKIVAKWKKDGKGILVTPFERVTKANRKRIADRAAELFWDEQPAVSFADE